MGNNSNQEPMNNSTDERTKLKEEIKNNLNITGYGDEDENEIQLGYVFVSYRKLDMKEVFNNVILPLHKQFGLRVYSDFAFEYSNEEWITPMQENLINSMAMIMFVSKNYICSYACFLELLTAIHHEIPIMPIFIDDIQPEKIKGKKNVILDMSPGTKAEFNNIIGLIADDLKMESVSGDYLQYLLSAKKYYYIIKKRINDGKLTEMDLSIQFKNLINSVSRNKDLRTNTNLSILKARIEDIIRDKKHPVFDTPVFPQNGVNEENIESSEITENSPTINNAKAAEQSFEEAQKAKAANKPTIGSITNSSTARDIGKPSSDNSYSFCGNTLSGNQSQMMTAVIRYIVEKHFDMFDTLLSQLTCLAKGSIKSQKLNYFNVGSEFTYRGVTYSIGTSYGRDAKLAQIRKAIELTGEDPHDYIIDGLYDDKQLKKAEQSFEEAQKAKAANKPAVASITAASPAKDIGKPSSDNCYTFCGNTVSGNQSQMMTEVMKYIVEKHFDMFDTLSEQLTCLEKGTIKSQKKNFFNIGGEFTYRGVTYSIGTSYGRDAKLAQIRKAIILTGENPHDYQIDGLFNEKQLKEAEERYAEMKAANDTDINAETNMEAVEILCCFLSKFNNEAAMKLGCSNISNAFAVLSERYGVKETYIRNLRDSFDPFFPESGRKGWWQNMDKFGASRQMLIDRFKAFKNADEAFSFVKNAVGI